MSENVARWREEHGRFARLLDILEEQLDRFHWAETPNYRLMLDIIDYMSHYPDTCHHPREDLAFAKVATREPATRSEVEALALEHAELKASGDKLAELLECVLEDAILTRSEVEEPGRNYIRYLRDHILREEALFPSVEALLGPEDWSAIDRKMPQLPDPLFGEEHDDRYEDLRPLAMSRLSRLELTA